MWGKLGQRDQICAGRSAVRVKPFRATGWDFSTGWYGDFVDQDVVYEMVDWGVMALIGLFFSTDTFVYLPVVR